MDEIALYDVALTPAQVEAHWTAYRDNVGDSDGDGIVDTLDNCSAVPNAD